MSDKEIQEAYERAERNYEMLKDRVHDQYFEIENLKLKIDKALEHIQENYSNEDGEIWHEGIEIIFNILKGE